MVECRSSSCDFVVLSIDACTLLRSLFTVFFIQKNCSNRDRQTNFNPANDVNL